MIQRLRVGRSGALPKVISLIVLSGLLSSCIIFERQTTSYHYDAAADELRVFVVYEGIYDEDADAEEPLLTPSEIDLFVVGIEDDSVGPPIPFPVTWKSHDERIEKLRRKLAKARRPKPRLEAELAYREAVDEAVEVVARGFYLDDEGRLSGYRAVKISGFTGLIEAANRWKTSEVCSRSLTRYPAHVREAIHHVCDTATWAEYDGSQLITRTLVSPKVVRQEWSEPDYPADLGGRVTATYEEPFLIGPWLSGAWGPGNNDRVREWVEQHYELARALDIQKLHDHFLETGELPR